MKGGAQTPYPVPLSGLNVLCPLEATQHFPWRVGHGNGAWGVAGGITHRLISLWHSSLS